MCPQWVLSFIIIAIEHWNRVKEWVMGDWLSNHDVFSLSRLPLFSNVVRDVYGKKLGLGDKLIQSINQIVCL